MNTLDARGVLVDAIKRGRHGAQKTGRTLSFRCPRHADSHASAWLGDHQWGCSACGFTEGFRTLADALGVTLPDAEARGLTLADYADRKGLRLSVLREAGVHEVTGKFGDTIVAIPYRDATGAVLRTKMRGLKRSWWHHDGEGTPLYGLDRLAEVPPHTPVLLVEGESDCHAGWERGLAVVGVPGASNLRAHHVEALGTRPVIVWQEPDVGGATLVASVAKLLPKAKVLSGVQYRGNPVKDLCDLHQLVAADAVLWSAVWPGILHSAIPIGATPPAVACDSLTGDTLEQLLTEKLAPIDALPTPLVQWNELCGGAGGRVGIARGWLVTVGALSGTGKSLFGVNVAAHAITFGEVVCFVSLEMTRSELATRLMAVVSGQPVIRLEQGKAWDSGAFAKAALQLDEIRATTGGHVLMNRRPISRVEDVIGVLKYYAEYEGIRTFVLDYVQLVKTSGGHSVSERMDIVMGQLRVLALEYGLRLVILSQFNRDTSKQREVRPTKEGLMGGSSVENDSHQVLLFDFTRWEKVGTMAHTWIIVDKNRHGAQRDLPVTWDFETLRLIERDPGDAVLATLAAQEKQHGRLTRTGRL